MNEYVTLLNYLVGPSVVGLVVWVWLLWRSHMEHKVHVAETYVRTPELNKIQATMTAIQEQLSKILETVHELKGAASAHK